MTSPLLHHSLPVAPDLLHDDLLLLGEQHVHVPPVVGACQKRAAAVSDAARGSQTLGTVRPLLGRGGVEGCTRLQRHTRRAGRRESFSNPVGFQPLASAAILTGKRAGPVTSGRPDTVIVRVL